MSPMGNYVPSPKKTIWKTKYGELIPIKNMTDDHLVNTVNMLRRYAEYQKAALIFQESMFTGEIANQMFEDMQTEAMIDEDGDWNDRLLESEIPQWKHLNQEARKRGLNERLR